MHILTRHARSPTPLSTITATVSLPYLLVVVRSEGESQYLTRKPPPSQNTVGGLKRQSMVMVQKIRYMVMNMVQKIQKMVHEKVDMMVQMATPR